MLIRYLIENGHTRIGVIAGKEENLHTVERLIGYKKVLKEEGIKYDRSIVLFADWERETGKECAKKLISKGVTTIWCMNDLMAAGAYDAVLEAGLTVGRDISVFGFDNREISEYMYPQLSTCELPLKGIGETCAELIIKEIEDEHFRDEPAVAVKVPCKLIPRDSVCLAQ